MPFFSIVVPAMGRPLHTREAAFSALHQDFGDFNVILSNNGADPEVKAAVSDFLEDPRFRYIEQPNVLPMPVHWDRACQLADGEYVLVLTNRSVLKRKALRKLAQHFSGAGGNDEVATWRWDDYVNAEERLVRSLSNSGEVMQLNSEEELWKFARVTNLVHHAYTFPRGENCCVSRDLLEENP